jgi:DNA-binding GntR family transcriptional regulator
MVKHPKAESAFVRLRADILAGQFAPGSRLRYVDICDRYGISMGSAREAMLRLAEQGLAQGEPQHGFSVKRLSPAELIDLTEARIDIESLVLERALEGGDLEWEARLLAAHHRMDRTPLVTPSDSDTPGRLHDPWITAHQAFHLSLLDGCPNLRLKGVAASLRDATDLYRSWSLPFGVQSARDVRQEHAELLDASLRRDSALAVRLLSAHIQCTTDSLLASPEGQRADDGQSHRTGDTDEGAP